MFALNFSSPVLAYLNAYQPVEFIVNEEIQNDTFYVIGLNESVYLGNNVPETFNVGIVNPSNDS